MILSTFTLLSSHHHRLAPAPLIISCGNSYNDLFLIAFITRRGALQDQEQRVQIPETWCCLWHRGVGARECLNEEVAEPPLRTLQRRAVCGGHRVLAVLCGGLFCRSLWYHQPLGCPGSSTPWCCDWIKCTNGLCFLFFQQFLWQSLALVRSWFLLLLIYVFMHTSCLLRVLAPWQHRALTWKYYCWWLMSFFIEAKMKLPSS